MVCTGRSPVRSSYVRDISTSEEGLASLEEGAEPLIQHNGPGGVTILEIIPHEITPTSCVGDVTQQSTPLIIAQRIQNPAFFIIAPFVRLSKCRVNQGVCHVFFQDHHFQGLSTSNALVMRGLWLSNYFPTVWLLDIAACQSFSSRFEALDVIPNSTAISWFWLSFRDCYHLTWDPKWGQHFLKMIRDFFQCWGELLPTNISLSWEDRDWGICAGKSWARVHLTSLFSKKQSVTIFEC